jgi:hypothetical protein
MKYSKKESNKKWENIKICNFFSIVCSKVQNVAICLLKRVKSAIVGYPDVATTLAAIH